MTANPPRDDSKPIIPFPRTDTAQARLRAREHQMAMQLSPEWNQRMREQWRFLLALRKLGVLISMYVILRKGARDAASCEGAAQAFRKAGFIVLWSGNGGLTLVGEPCLALTFMFKAADVGVLSDDLEESLAKIVDDETPLRVEDYEGALEPIEPVMPAIEIIVSPSMAKAN
jgi:hypothetical protein